MRYESERIISQHSQLGELHQLVASELDRGAVHSARQAFERFEEALQAHLEVDERIYFPALGALRPRLTDEIATLVQEHDGIFALLPGLRSLLRGGEMELSRERLRDLARLISDHESREEALVLASLEQTASDASEHDRDVSFHSVSAGHADLRAAEPDDAAGLARHMQTSSEEEEA